MASPDTLMELTLASSVAIGLVLLLRRPLRKAFGARVAYGAWTLVPVAMVAVLLPAADVAPATGALIAMPRALPSLVQPAVGIAAGPWLMACWLAGLVLSAGAMALRQWRFRRRLGRLTLRADGMRESERDVEGLPATLGLWAPHVVVPPAFEARYDAAQRDLMLAHERVHVRRGDVQANAVASLLRCLFWFNPLMHLAAPRFRQDQELACDAVVLSLYPCARRRYGEALLQAQLFAQATPLGCHFGFGHPLKERIAMLGQPLPTTTRRVLGGVLVCAGALGMAFAAWAAQPQAAAPANAAQGIGVQSLPPPRYPSYAAEHYLEGRIDLLVDVAADGSVTNVVVEHSEPTGVFDEAASKAARNWKFNPASKDGKPVAGRVRVPVNFSTDPKDGEEAAPMKMGPDAVADPADYDWIRQDTATMGGLRETQCDVVKLDSNTGIAYCGILRQ